MTRITTFSSLYPNSIQPRHGIFVEQRLRQLLASKQVEARVIAPVPWFPFDAGCFGRYGEFARIPTREQRHGIEIMHPRYVVIPKVGMTLAPTFMATAMKTAFRKLIHSGYDFDLIDAHYLYPDGVAAAMLGEWLGKPVVITARGTDVNLIARHRWPRKMILQAARQCSGIVTVSCALKDALVKLGVPAPSVTVLRNGVDLNFFRPPQDVHSLRRGLEVSDPTLMTVGNLFENKGHHIAIEALTQLCGVRLIVVGEGDMRYRLEQLACTMGVRDRVKFTGLLTQEELVRYYGAVDAVVVASATEGMPNVLLEAIACGTPVIATRTGGIPEILAAPEAGILLPERSVGALVDAVQSLFRSKPERGQTRRYAEQFSWQSTTHGQLDLFTEVLSAGPP
ncbi:MAG: glycosyltransferase [Gammaproteobacteria bacterium]